VNSAKTPTGANDAFNLDRFVRAQRAVFDAVRLQLMAGEKTSHWMWFIFPQLAGLGYSQRAVEFAISSRQEGDAYIRHPLLGPRLLECTRLVLQVQDRSLQDIFGYPDDLKFRSSMTLFGEIAPETKVFKEALQKYCGGDRDERTLQLLKSSRHSTDECY